MKIKFKGQEEPSQPERIKFRPSRYGFKFHDKREFDLATPKELNPFSDLAQLYLNQWQKSKLKTNEKPRRVDSNSYKIEGEFFISKEDYEAIQRKAMSEAFIASEAAIQAMKYLSSQNDHVADTGRK